MHFLTVKFFYLSFFKLEKKYDDLLIVPDYTDACEEESLAKILRF